MYNAVEWLGPQGPLTHALSHYEYRAVQLDMAKGVEDALSSGRHLVVEAGTGVGKSFAYLIPAIQYALQHQKKVVVSTYTISLQEQLIQKDIPMLAQALPIPFRAVLVKGRGNYLSLRRLKRAVEHSFDLFEKDESVEELGKILGWSTVTKEGSLQDLHEEVHEGVWDKVVSDVDNCLGKKCPTYRQCFFFSARRKMEEADLLIVNHHLFFSDLSLRRGGLSFLPDYDTVIFDEAHTMEQVAAEHMGFELSNGQVRFLLDSLLNAEGTKGFLISLEDPATRKRVQRARREAQGFFKEVEEFLKEFPEAKRVREEGVFSGALVQSLRDIRNSLGEVLKEARNKEEELDIQSYRKRCEAIAFSLERFLKQDLGNYVYWASRSKGRLRRITLHAAPIHCGEILQKELFQKVRSIVMTSATLATEGNFQYFKERHGILEADEMLLGSPFNYRKQVTLSIPVGMPDPADYERFRDYISLRVRERLEGAEGGVFVLFTSYRLMRDVYALLKPFLDERGLQSFQQGESLSRHEMLQAFKADGNSVLFGTDSFWQGVDVPGKALSQVIITKLPFSVPDHPMIEARIEELEARGEDPFLSYTLPEAILKLKQGFGRLIRTQKDEGSIVILDDRILRKPYGQRFLKSLPACELLIG
ncbi:MAG: DEAD/DEAH box helicase [Candidatus Omnitrophica bacterium]|nr:DEAD/DEAH box helicase [Candidatus Omnitrophota bacterium]